jgi:hypothetical protein
MFKIQPKIVTKIARLLEPGDSSFHKVLPKAESNWIPSTKMVSFFTWSEFIAGWCFQPLWKILYIYSQLGLLFPNTKGKRCWALAGLVARNKSLDPCESYYCGEWLHLNPKKPKKWVDEHPQIDLTQIRFVMFCLFDIPHKYVAGSKLDELNSWTDSTQILGSSRRKKRWWLWWPAESKTYLVGELEHLLFFHISYINVWLSGPFRKKW